VPHRSLRSALLPVMAAVPVRIGFDRSAGSPFFTNVVRYRPDAHEVHRNLDLVRILGWSGDAPVPEIFPGTAEKNEVDRFCNHLKQPLKPPFVTMAPGSVWPTKRWLPERFAATALRIRESGGMRSVLVGGPADRAIAETIESLAGKAVVNAVGQFSMRSSAELISRSRVLLANDSAPLHLGVAVHIPVVALFGPTIPGFGFAPFGEGHTVIEKNMDCRPCGIHGGRRCPKRHFQCMNGIDVDHVVAALERYL